MATNTNKFLSYAGLETFWSLIKAKFVSGVELTSSESGAVLNVTMGDGTSKSAGTIPMATETNAGLMSAAQAKTVNEFSEGVAALIPLTDVKIKGTSTTLSERAANIDFIYNSEAKEIQVIDLNNASAVLTKIDASAFIKDGMLDSVAMGEGENRTKIIFTFNTDAGKEAIPVDLSAFVDVYTAGNGLDLAGNVFSVKFDSSKGAYIAATADGVALTDAFWAEVDRRDTVVKEYADGLNTAMTTKVDNLETSLKSYADTAEQDAKDYADAAVATAVGKVAEEGQEATGLRKEIADAKAAAIAEAQRLDAIDLQSAKDYADAAVAAVVGEGGTLAGTLEAAKAYTDQEVGALSNTVTETLKGYYTKSEVYTKDEVNTELAKKANVADVNASLDLKADKATMAEELAKKANVADVYSKTEMVDVLAPYAKTADVNSTLEAYAKTADVNSTLEAYAKTADVEASLLEITKDGGVIDTKIEAASSSLSGDITALGNKIGDVPTGSTVMAEIAAAEGRAAADATSKANTAEANAKSYVDGKVTEVNTTITTKIEALDSSVNSLVVSDEASNDDASVVYTFAKTISQTDGKLDTAVAETAVLKSITVNEIKAIVNA